MSPDRRQATGNNRGADVPPPLFARVPASLDLYCLCAAWCRTCDEARPLLAGVLADPDLQGRVQLRWVDIEDEADALGDYDVETFPTLLIASTGQARFLGPVEPRAAAIRGLLLRELQSASTPLDAEAQALLHRLG